MPSLPATALALVPRPLEQPAAYVLGDDSFPTPTRDLAVQPSPDIVLVLKLHLAR
jgi:hypothetical protein